jgi:nitroimidazol reductase NimA-like FMN-containing flavoprotein (pyridoxamine 5'-phosphate oxidase superfamily)
MSDDHRPRRQSYPVTPRTTVDRAARRASYDRETVHAILDAGLVCHVGVAVDGQPYVVPMAYGRDGERLLLHGSVASRLGDALTEGLPVCVTVTHLDGLVFARSGFSSSMNYRSVMVLGHAREITDPAEKVRALDILADHLAAGRSGEQREHTDKEVAATRVLELPLEEVSAKVRKGPPEDQPRDLELPIWAGVLPLETVAGEPLPSPNLPEGIELAPSVRDWGKR